MNAEFNAKNQQVKAQQLFDMDYKKHAEDNQGFTQEGVVKHLHERHLGKNKDG